MPGLKDVMIEVDAACVQLRKAWKLKKEQSKAEWEKWKKGKKAEELAGAEAAYQELVFEDGLGKLLESWHKNGDNYSKFHSHYVKIHKIQHKYHKISKAALKELGDCKKVCTLLIKEMDEQIQIVDDWLQTAKLVYDTDLDAALKESKEETKAVQQGKMIPPIILISLPVATVLKNAGLKADQIARIDMDGTLEVILSDAEIRREFAKQEVDVSALCKLTNSAALHEIASALKEGAIGLLEKMDDGKLDEDKAEDAFKVLIDKAVEEAVGRAVEEAERLSSIKKIAKYATVKSAFKVVALALGVVAGEAVMIGGALSVNPAVIAIGLYSTYKAVNKLMAEVTRLSSDFDTIIDKMQRAIIQLGTHHGALKEATGASINELLGNQITPTISDLMELYGSAVDKLAREEATVDQVSKKLDGMMSRSDALSAQINKLQKAMDAEKLDAKAVLGPLRKEAEALADQISETIIEVMDLNGKVETMNQTLGSLQGEVAQLRDRLGDVALYAAIAVSTGLSAGLVAGLGFAAELGGATSKVCSLVNTGISAGNKTVVAAQAVTGYLKDKHSERAKTKLS